MQPTAATGLRMNGDGGADGRDREPVLGADVQPRVVVVPDMHVKSWPKHLDAPHFDKLSLGDALTRRYKTDALILQYESPCRVGKEIFDRDGGCVPMVLATFDFDGPDHVATLEWRDDHATRIAALLEVNPDLFPYDTPRGARLVSRLPEPRILRSAADAQAWRREYLIDVVYLERVFGLVADPQCANFSHLHRVPFGTRDGVLQCLPTYGDPYRIGSLTTHPTAEDVAEAERRHRSIRYPSVVFDPSPPPSAADPKRIAPWVRGALDSARRAIRESPAHTRNQTLDNQAIGIGEIVAGGGLDECDARAELLSVWVGTLGKSAAEGNATITSAFRKGARNPRFGPPDRDRYAPSHSTPSAGDQPPPSAAKDQPPPNDNTPGPRFVIESGEVLFAKLPPKQWVAPSLMIGPGRPTQIQGFGGSLKSLSGQSMLVSLAAGQPIWNHFACDPVSVAQIDFEQGRYDTLQRLQRLAIGHGIDPREIAARLGVCALPPLYLTDPAAEEALRVLADKVRLILIDSLRAGLVGVDENDSNVRVYLDMMTRVSESTGCAFVVLHHARKPSKDGSGDARMHGRGSGAIFDACGCVLDIVAGRTGNDAKRVTMTKPPAGARGASLEPFDLVVEDVPHDGDPHGGVRVVWRAATAAADPTDSADAKYEADAARLLQMVKKHVGASQAVIVERAGLMKARGVAVLAALVEDGRLTVTVGPRNAKTYLPVPE
jgi:hypothetical protein